MHLRPTGETPTINLKTLMDLLRSEDEQMWENAKWMFDGKLRFLDGEKNKSQKVAFCSFPRSGNTFLRKYLELMTGIYTGADNPLHVNVVLQCQGMAGEEIVDDTVWIAKTHTPWIMPDSPPFPCNKIIVIVRNPLDTNLSWLHLVAMNNHATKSPFDYETTYPVYFDWWVKDCVTYINNWMLTMMREAKFRKVPILFIRFEDLVKDPTPWLYSTMKFLLGKADLTNTNAERRIKEVLAMGAEATQAYALKSSTKMKNANVHRYTQEQIAWVTETCKEWLHFFGYAQVPQDPDNATGFFEYDGTDPELMRQYYGFRAQNESHVQWVCQLTDKDLEQYQWMTCNPAMEVPLMDFATSVKATRPIKHYIETKFYGQPTENVE